MNFRHRVLKDGYFPKELPPPFTTHSFAHFAVANPNYIRRLWNPFPPKRGYVTKLVRHHLAEVGRSGQLLAVAKDGRKPAWDRTGPRIAPHQALRDAVGLEPAMQPGTKRLVAVRVAEERTVRGVSIRRSHLLNLRPPKAERTPASVCERIGECATRRGRFHGFGAGRQSARLPARVTASERRHVEGPRAAPLDFATGCSRTCSGCPHGTAALPASQPRGFWNS